MTLTKSKGIRKGASGMDFHSYAKRILYMHGHHTINRMPNKKIQKRLQVKIAC